MSEAEVKEIDKLFLQALKFHQDGDIESAKSLYSKVLELDRDHVKTLCNLGIIYKNANNYSKALNVLNHALVVDGKNVVVLQNLANLYKTINSLDKAIAILVKITEIQPKNPNTYFDIALILEHQGKVDNALSIYKKVISLDKDFVEAYHKIAFLLFKKERFDDAVSIFEMVLKIKPDDVATLCNIGLTYNFATKYSDAIKVLEKAISIDSSYKNAYIYLGDSYNGLKRFKDALPCYLNVLQDDPKNVRCHQSIAKTYKNLHMIDQAVTSLKSAIELNPDFAEAHYDLSTIELMGENLQAGFKEYEWRYKRANMTNFIKQRSLIYKKPRFTRDSNPDDKTLLIYTEENSSETFLFLRFIATLRKTLPTLKVKVYCDNSLISILKKQPFIDEVVDSIDTLGEFDYQISINSLPYLLDIEQDSLPLPILYIDSEFDNEDLNIDKKYINIGIDLGKDQDLSLMKFAPLMLSDTLRVNSLSIGSNIDEIQSYGLEEDDIVDLGKYIKDYQDLATVISKMDLIITADTVVADIASSLNKTVYVLAKYTPHWKWMLKEESSSWYKMAKIYREDNVNKWDDVYKNILDDVSQKFDLELKRR